MENYKPGDRVGAVLSKNDRVMRLFGYGIFEGNRIPTDPRVKLNGKSLSETRISNPCILLDSGQRVYGVECYWGDEEMIQVMVDTARENGVEIQTVDVEKWRSELESDSQNRINEILNR